MRSIVSSLVILVSVLVAGVSAFAPSSRSSLVTQSATGIRAPQKESNLILNERRWNFNEIGRSPWGMKNNAEIWNGRMAQMGFTIVLLQELVTGKGVVKGLQEGDPVNLAFLGFAVLSVVALTAWLAIKGTDQYFDTEQYKE